MFSLVGLFALAVSGIPSALAVGTALGYGSATVGGGSATAAVPSSTTELLEWLADDAQVWMLSGQINLALLANSCVMCYSV